MQRWVKQHLTIAVLLSLISIAAMGVAYAAVLNADVEHLKEQVLGSAVKPSLSDRLTRLEQKTDDIQEGVHRIEGYITQ